MCMRYIVVQCYSYAYASVTSSAEGSIVSVVVTSVSKFIPFGGGGGGLLITISLGITCDF